nr:MAG TPA: hypothetical protein [Caudoviricetes sp.]DAG68514.1 MAG TPA: hypothetical protein [Caudoviricetes sp.]
MKLHKVVTKAISSVAVTLQPLYLPCVRLVEGAVLKTVWM